LKLAALLLVAIVALAWFTAAAIVPDPTWIGGLYDGADGDEAAALVWERAHATAPGVVAVVPITRIALVSPGPLALAPCCVTAASASRAPPA